MTDPNLLRSNVSPINPLITDVNNSAWLPQAPQALNDFFRDTRQLASTVPTGFNTTITFDLTKQGTSLLGWTWKSTFAPVAVTSGTFARYQDFIGIMMFKQIRVNYVGNELYKYGREYMFLRIRKWLTQERRICINDAIFGERTPAQMSALTQTGFITYTPSFVPFSHSTDQASPITTLAQKLRIEADIESVENLLQTDGVISSYSTSTVTTVMLADYVQTPDNDTISLINKSKEQNGIVYLVNNKSAVQNYIVSAAAGTISSEVRMLQRGVVKAFYFWLTPNRLVNTPGSNNYTMIQNNPVPVPALMGVYDPIDHFEADSNGVYAVRPQAAEERYNKAIYHPYYHSSACGDNIYFWSWTLNPETENAAFGNLAFPNLDTPTLRIYWGASGTGIDPITAGAQELRLTVIELIYSFIQYQGGDVTEVFV